MRYGSYHPRIQQPPAIFFVGENKIIYFVIQSGVSFVNVDVKPALFIFSVRDISQNPIAVAAYQFYTHVYDKKTLPHSYHREKINQEKFRIARAFENFKAALPNSP
jgi:hypothetical protein